MKRFYLILSLTVFMGVACKVEDVSAALSAKGIKAKAVESFTTSFSQGSKIMCSLKKTFFGNVGPCMKNACIGALKLKKLSPKLEPLGKGYVSLCAMTCGDPNKSGQGLYRKSCVDSLHSFASTPEDGFRQAVQGNAKLRLLFCLHIFGRLKHLVQLGVSLPATARRVYDVGNSELCTPQVLQQTAPAAAAETEF